MAHLTRVQPNDTRTVRQAICEMSDRVAWQPNRNSRFEYTMVERAHKYRPVPVPEDCLPSSSKATNASVVVPARASKQLTPSQPPTASLVLSPRVQLDALVLKSP